MENTPRPLSPGECLKSRSQVGGKAFHLAELAVTLELPVPQFIAVPTPLCAKIADRSIDLAALCRVLTQDLPASRYAVRSSVLIEDTAQSAMAGQFTTLLGVDPSSLPAAIEQIIRDVVAKGYAADQCAVIIQEFIAAEVSGVLFTRNPQGGHEALIEFIAGRGDALVSGEKKPERLVHYWNQPAAPAPRWLAPLVLAGRKIESQLTGPQDIEWCWKGGQLFIVQARPITTLTAADFQAAQLIDRDTPAAPFLYEQTEIAEIAPRPTPATLSLLKNIYRSGGPVDTVYARHGIRYVDTDFLRVIGNQLYVDRAAEKQSLFPDRSLGGKLTAYRNKRALEKMTLPDPRDLDEQLQAGFSRSIDFLEAYQLIFEINLVTQGALNQLEAAGRLLKRSAAELLAVPTAPVLADFLAEKLSGLEGNSLELGDESPFQRATPRILVTPAWFSQLPRWQQDFIQPRLAAAQAFSALRERGRWYTVFLTNQLKRQHEPFDSFLSLEEIGLTPRPDSSRVEREWSSFNALALPGRISNQPLTAKAGPRGISPGLGEGLVVGRNELGQSAKKAILATDLLTPDLVALFPHLAGIIASTGGQLSHLAIMAREAGIPVVSGVPNTAKWIGKNIVIDGSTGTITNS